MTEILLALPAWLEVELALIPVFCLLAGGWWWVSKHVEIATDIKHILRKLDMNGDS